jgi:hypothetical protein
MKTLARGISRDIVVPGRKGLEYIPRVIGGHQAPVAGRAQRHRLVDTTVAREPGDHLVILGPAHHHPGPRIAEEMLELPGRVAGIQRQVDEAGAHAAEIETQRLRGLVHLDGDPVTRLRPKGREAVRELRRRAIQPGVGELPAIGGLDGHGVRSPGEAPAQQLVEVGVSVLAHCLPSKFKWN